MNDSAAQHLARERRRLEAARALLLEAAAGASTPDRPGTGAHLADDASDTLDREIDLSLVHAVAQEIAEIEAAEARLAAGTFGRCEICGGRIGAERLRAIPWATRCVADQVRAETIDESLRADVLHGPSEAEALRNSDLIPDEDRAEEGELSSEERALHIQ